jgi:hypothetical protein
VSLEERGDGSDGLPWLPDADDIDGAGTWRTRSAGCTASGWMGVGASSVTSGQAVGTVGEGSGVGCCVLGLGRALDADAEAEAVPVAVVAAECRECWRR